MVKVEVVHIDIASKIFQLQLNVEPGSTVADVLRKSGIKQQYPELDTLAVGIFAKTVSRDTIVQSGDRLELYRELIIDPKESRRQRAAK
jgi:putative ubiquitin-RnfH superfamily antitoxin RatB of RatAB toxin-antitoxin module